MLRNEIRLFFSVKNVLALFVAILAMLLVYQYSYIPAYENVPQEEILEIENQMNDVSFYIKKYKDMSAQYEEMEPGSETAEELKKMLAVWEKYDSRKKMLVSLWITPEKDADTILLFNKQVDEMMLEVSPEWNMGIDLLYNETQRDWQERMLLHEAYEQEGWQEPVIVSKPTGGYVLYDALSGNSVIFLILVILLVFWNYAIWSADFDNTTYKVLYTLPYSKMKIFSVRCLVHWFFSMVGVLMVLAGLFIKGTITYGSGWETFQIVNGQALSKWGFLSNEVAMSGVGDFAIKLQDIILIRLSLMSLFLTLAFCVIQFISYAVANGTSAIITFTAILLSVYATAFMGTKDIAGKELTVLERINPIYFFQNEAILHGDKGIGVPLVILLEIAVAVVILAATNYWMRRRER